MIAEVAALLVESDRRYFAAGSEALAFPGGVLRWIPGLQHVAAGCILEWAGSVAADRFAQAALGATTTIGAPLLRFYSSGGSRELASAWEEQGFEPGIELAYACRPEPIPSDMASLRFRPVVTPGDWAVKEALAAAGEDPPDGKHASPGDWTMLERRKSEAGYALFYLAERDGVPCAAFGLSDCGPLLRVKNVAVHPDFRRQGVGRALLAFAQRHALHHGYEWVGVFALEGGDGARLYSGCGFQLVGSQTEWTKRVPANFAQLAASEEGMAAC
jgi:GNAT superfamily N-acetyltransferase